jgi:hypothetical protein
VLNHRLAVGVVLIVEEYAVKLFNQVCFWSAKDVVSSVGCAMGASFHIHHNKKEGIEIHKQTTLMRV